MLSKFSEQVADKGSQRFCGVPAALESPRHGNSHFRLSRLVVNVDAAIADQLSTGTEYDAQLVPSSGRIRVHTGQFFKIGSQLVHRCGFPRLIARYLRVRAIEQQELRVEGPKIPKVQSVGDDVLEHALNSSRIEPVSSQIVPQLWRRKPVLKSRGGPAARLLNSLSYLALLSLAKRL